MEAAAFATVISQPIALAITSRLADAANAETAIASGFAYL